MTVATATKPTAPRKRRTRKVAVKTVQGAAPKAVKVTTPKRPSAAKLISPNRYWSDIKTRWAIHTLHWGEFIEDCKWVINKTREWLKPYIEKAKPYVKKAIDKVKDWYKKIQE